MRTTGKGLWYVVMLLLSLGLRTGAVAGESGGLPGAKISLLSGSPPSVDGNLDEPCWKQATVVKDFVVSRKEASVKPAVNGTEVYFLRSDRVFYIGARCFDADMKNLSPNDMFEVFVADKNLLVYYHFWICPSGSINQDGSPGVFTGVAGVPFWHGKVTLHEKYWQVEMAIPFFNFSSEYMSDDLWRLNVCREKYTEPRENSQWSNTGGYFHVPDLFGNVTGMAGIDFTPSVDVAAGVKMQDVSRIAVPDYMILNRSYYTVEPEAIFRICLNEETAGKMPVPVKVEATVKNDRGSRVFRKEWTVGSPASLLVIEGNIPLGDMAVGDYAVAVRVIPKGQPATEFAQTLQKLPPNSSEVKIDRFSRLLLVNGKPFIPLINEIMFWGRKLSGHDVPDNGLEVFARDSGFQSVILWGSTPFSEQNVADCSALGLKMVLFMQAEMEKAMRAGGQEAVTKRLEEIFAQYKDEPNLLAWFLADEGNLFADEKYFKERYARLKKADPYHPIFRNEGAWAVGCGGVGGLDTTEIYCGGYGGYRLIDAINIDAVPRGIPSMSLTAWFGPPEHASYPTPAQTVARAYENFIHGSCGLFVWGVHGGKPPVPALWGAMMKIRRELDVLTPVFATEALREGAVSSSPSVHCTTRICDGTRYLVCVNVGDKEQGVVFSFPKELQPGSAVNVLFDGGTEKTADGKLKTVFQPYQRRVYTW